MATIDSILVAATCITCKVVYLWKQVEHNLSHCCPQEPLVEVQNI